MESKNYYYSVPKECPFCNSVNIDNVFEIHECETIAVYEVVCYECERDFIGLTHKIKM